MVVDSLADLLTQIRNANLIYKDSLEIPASKIKWAMTLLLKEEGFIKDCSLISDKVTGKNLINVVLKYGSGKRRVISGIRRISKPGCRVKQYRKGFGVTLLSTPKGILTDKSAYQQKVGGEVLCVVW